MAYGLREMAADALAGRLRITEDELQRERIKVCESCEHFGPALRKCALCGCQLDLKTRELRAECPLSKW